MHRDRHGIPRRCSVTGPTNADRAAWAEIAVQAFQEVCETDDCDAIGDLICNLLHAQRRRLAAQGEPFDAVAFASSRGHLHNEEVEEDNEGED